MKAWLEERRWLRLVRDVRRFRDALPADRREAFDAALRPMVGRRRARYPEVFYAMTREGLLRAQLAATLEQGHEE